MKKKIKSNWLIVFWMSFTVLAIAFLVVCLTWSIQHSAWDYIKPCILNGYDSAEWPMFAKEPICVKRVPLSQAVKGD